MSPPRLGESLKKTHCLSNTIQKTSNFNYSDSNRQTSPVVYHKLVKIGRVYKGDFQTRRAIEEPIKGKLIE